MREKLRNYIEASICPQFFYEEKLPHLWLFSLILPALTGLFSMLSVGLDRYSAGLCGADNVVEVSLLGLALGVCSVFFRAAVIKIISVFTADSVAFQELSYAIGASFGVPLFISFIGFVLRVVFSLDVSGAFLLVVSLTQLIPLYYLMIYLNLGGIKKTEDDGAFDRDCRGHRSTVCFMASCLIRFLPGTKGERSDYGKETV